jgi:hypothetical protein
MYLRLHFGTGARQGCRLEWRMSWDSTHQSLNGLGFQRVLGRKVSSTLSICQAARRLNEIGRLAWFVLLEHRARRTHP